MPSRFLEADIPKEYHANFLHLYFDIGWFGILSGTSINFVKIYAARLGASGLQIGMLDASAAMVSLLLAIPAGQWVGKRSISKAVFRTSVLYRIGFLFWALLPWFFGNTGQVWALIALALLMAIPLTPLAVGFNALFAAAVPEEYRAHVAGVRNAVFSIAYVLASLGSGYLLGHLPFPAGYQVVFGIGFFGAAMSSLHLYFVRPLTPAAHPPLSDPNPAEVPERTNRRFDFSSASRADVWSTRFRNVLLVMMGFHLAQYLALPLFPLYQVNQLHLTDDQIGIGSALFYLIVFIGSTQLRRTVHRLGHRTVTGLGALAMGLYPLLLALSRTAYHFYGVSALGGMSWALAGGAYANYLLECIPAHDRPAYLAWYNVVLNACVLAGSLIGPLVAKQVGLVTALFLFAAARMLAGAAILKWG